MLNSTFKLVYLILFIAASVVRRIFTAKNKRHEFIERHKSVGDTLLLLFDGIGMMIPLVYIFSPWLDFANYSMPEWIAWAGTCLFILAIYILYLSHADLGKNWSPVLGIKKEHTLVTSGIYNYIRHPMYAAHLLWAVAQIFILHNWIAGFSFIAVMVPHYLLRVGKEEAMLVDQFGDEYRSYIKQTGRIIPKMRR